MTNRGYWRNNENQPVTYHYVFNGETVQLNLTPLQDSFVVEIAQLSLFACQVVLVDFVEPEMVLVMGI